MEGVLDQFPEENVADSSSPSGPATASEATAVACELCGVKAEQALCYLMPQPKL